MQRLRRKGTYDGLGRTARAFHEAARLCQPKTFRFPVLFFTAPPHSHFLKTFHAP
jgi:hypothetical protein